MGLNIFQTDAGFNKQSKCYEIRTHNTYRKYDQVFISYGAHNNTHLLLEYGFTLPNNPHDVYDINYGMYDIYYGMYECWTH